MLNVFFFIQHSTLNIQHSSSYLHKRKLPRRRIDGHAVRQDAALAAAPEHARWDQVGDDLLAIDDRLNRIAATGEQKSDQTDAILEALLEVAELRLDRTPK